jgi:hypothetical protein
MGILESMFVRKMKFVLGAVTELAGLSTVAAIGVCLRLV